MSQPKTALAMVIAAVGGGAALFGAASAAPNWIPPPRPLPGTGLPSGQCFLLRDARSHVVADAHTMLLAVNKRVYMLSMGNACLAAATNSDTVVFDHPGTAYICRAVDLDVGVRMHGFVHRCIVNDIVSLGPAEVAALPPRLRP